MKELVLKASDETLYTVLDEIRNTLSENGCDEDAATQIAISAEEVFVNIAHYAYGGEAGEAIVDIELTTDPKIIRITFKDRGIPYNPLEKQDPDTDLSADERAVGGLGIFMVKTMMDNVEYRYEDGQNILTIEKNIEKITEKP